MALVQEMRNGLDCKVRLEPSIHALREIQPKRRRPRNFECSGRMASGTASPDTSGRIGMERMVAAGWRPARQCSARAGGPRPSRRHGSRATPGTRRSGRPSSGSS